MSGSQAAMVPSRRLGGLLRDTRVARGVTLDDLAAQSFFTARHLSVIEAGERVLTDREVAEVLTAYRIDAEDLVPARTALTIDLDAKLIAAGDHQNSVAGAAPTADQVLASYLSFVYTLRRTEPGELIVLRADDIELLARALDLARPAVAARLHALMTEPAGEVLHRAGRLRGRVLVPMAGMVVAATAIGTLLLVPDGDHQTVVAGTGMPEPAFVVTNADGTTTPVYIGEGLRPEDLPPGAVALAPATQQFPGGLTVVNADGLPVPLQLPPNEIWLGDPQVAVRNDDGTHDQAPREP